MPTVRTGTTACVQDAVETHIHVFLYHQVLMERVVCEVRALAVLPTKELAQQVQTFKNKQFCLT